MSRKRLRELGIQIGQLPTGRWNGITDVPGVLVGHTTLISDVPTILRTGVTVIQPRAEAVWTDHVYGGCFTLSGNGEVTGIAWLEEVGIIDHPIAITNTFSVGTVKDSLIMHAIEHGYSTEFLPIVGETWDGWLSDIGAFAITREHVYQALENVSAGSVLEGNVGGGTGMICHDFKGGIGSSSRLVETSSGQYTVGVLVQTNYGKRDQLRIDGIPVGREIDYGVTPPAYQRPPESNSIIVIVATDAPLLPDQCKRLARRASLGLARAGGTGNDSSGDFFLAFSTGNHIPAGKEDQLSAVAMHHSQMSSLFAGVIDATEEAIINSMLAAETMEGKQGRKAFEIPTEAVASIIQRYR